MNEKLYHIEFKNALENEKHFYYRDLTILFKNQPPSKGELIQMKALERLYDKISNFLFGGEVMCRR